MKRAYVVALLMLAGCEASVPTSAPVATQEMVNARDPASVVAALHAKGYQAQLGTAGGEPSITSGAGGVKFSIFFENCTNGKACSTVAFATGFTDVDSNVDRLNEWNRQNRFARAYIDGEGDPVLRMDVDLDHGGIPRQNFNEYLDIWGSLAPKFLNFLRNR